MVMAAVDVRVLVIVLDYNLVVLVLVDLLVLVDVDVLVLVLVRVVIEENFLEVNFLAWSVYLLTMLNVPIIG